MICDKEACCTLIKSLENQAPCKPKVVEIQTAHGVTAINTMHLCYTGPAVTGVLYYVCDKLVLQPEIIVKACVVLYYL